MSVTEKLSSIQAKLKAPKGQRNDFGKYNYRSCEDILEAVKPLASAEGCAVIISDKPIMVGERHYIEATATLRCGNDVDMCVSVTAYAMEPETKKGMDLAQITGATSSYARKYALNGLFAIDDTKDSDATNRHDQQPKVDIAPKVKQQVLEQSLKCLENGDEHGLEEIWSEFGADERVVLWAMFNSQQRAAMKELKK